MMSMLSNEYSIMLQRIRLTSDVKALLRRSAIDTGHWVKPRSSFLFGAGCLAEGPRRKPGEKFEIAVKYNLKRKSMIARIRAMNHHTPGERLKSFNPLQLITGNGSNNGKYHML